MSLPALLAIDQGTTSTRAIVYDATSFVALGVAQQEIPQYYPRDGWVEHEPEEIWKSVKGTVREALARSGRDARGIAAIGITNQRETTVLWDRATGRPVGRAIVWQDRRTSDFCREEAGRQEWLTSKTGLVLDPYFSATKLRWMLNESRELRAQAQSGQLAFGTIDSFLIWRLTGGRVHATDATNASRTLLFNIHSLEWDEELLQFFDIPRSLLPEVKPSTGEFGMTSGLDFLDGIPIRGVAGDQQAALFGQRCFTAGAAKCTYGTGAFFLLHTGETARPSAHRLLTTVAAMTDSRPKFALEGAVFVAGAAVQWLRDGLRLFGSSAEVEQLVAEANPQESVLFVPGFVGLGAPHWSPEARGVIFGLTRATTGADLARAALEGVAFQVADLIVAAEGEGCPIGELRVDGGMTRNDWFLKCQADVLGCPIVRTEHGEATALGAAFLAGVGAGLADEPSLAAREFPARRFEPTLSHEERQRKLAQWHHAVQTVIAFYSVPRS